MVAQILVSDKMKTANDVRDGRLIPAFRHDAYYNMSFTSDCMLLYDVTRPLSPTLPVYPGDPVVELTPLAQCAWGDGFNMTRIVLSSHTGTHIDAPRHFFDAGKAVDRLDLPVLIGPARVIEVPCVSHVTVADLRAHDFRGVTRALFKTPNASLWDRPGFQSDYHAFTPEAAAWLVSRDVQLVGIDYLSVDAYDAEDFPVHRCLLQAGVVIVEGLDLRAVSPGDYELYALPLLLQDGDGAPARVLLRAV
jgi:arylformamidase